MLGTRNALWSAMVWNVGHRGSPSKEPENTFPSYEQAERDGANALEVDICVTADDELLIWHDCHPSAVEARLRQWNLEPQTKYCPRSFERPVREMTLAEARATLGYENVSAYLPTLGEVFEWSHAHPQIGLVFVDVKLSAANVHLVPTVLRRLEQLPRPNCEVVLECAEHAIASEMRRLGVRYPLGLDVWKKRGLEQAFRLGVDWTCAQKPRHVQWPFPSTRLRSVVRNAQSKNVCAFNINGAGEMATMLDMGVDAIMTDRPDVLAEVVASRRVALEAQSGLTTLLRNGRRDWNVSPSLVTVQTA
jgi:glycerophosphoryl diester phosphodiesterase